MDRSKGRRPRSLHTHTAFLSSSISAPPLLLLLLPLPQLPPLPHPHRRVRSAARLPPPRRPRCRVSPHSRRIAPCLAPPPSLAHPACTPHSPACPSSTHSRRRYSTFRPPSSPPRSLSFSLGLVSFELVSISSTPATLPRQPVPFFLFSSPLPSCAYFSTSFPSVSYRFSPSSTPFDPRYYTFTDPVSIRPSSSRFRSLHSASLSSFISFFLPSSSIYAYDTRMYIFYIYMYIHVLYIYMRACVYV